MAPARAAPCPRWPRVSRPTPIRSTRSNNVTQPHSDPTHPSPAPAAKRAHRILLVDDDRLQLKLTALRLRRAGFIVTTAATAQEGLDLAKTDVPDAVLSDVIMGE